MTSAAFGLYSSCCCKLSRHFGQITSVQFFFMVLLRFSLFQSNDSYAACNRNVQCSSTCIVHIPHALQMPLPVHGPGFSRTRAAEVGAQGDMCKEKTPSHHRFLPHTSFLVLVELYVKKSEDESVSTSDTLLCPFGVRATELLLGYT